MSLLSKTGLAGVADYEQCGFPLGNNVSVNTQDFEEKINEYEQSQVTPNGVFGCKISWEQFRVFQQAVGAHIAYVWLWNVDHHILLHRGDKVAQAVSFHIARQRQYFSSLKSDRGQYIDPTPPYDYHAITAAKIEVETYDFQNQRLLDAYGFIPEIVRYEDLVAHRTIVMDSLFKMMGLPAVNFGALQPHIRQQKNPAKEKYRNQYIVQAAGYKSGV